MKNSLFFLLIFLLAGISIAASKTAENPILGKWELVKVSPDRREKERRNSPSAKRNWIDFRENNIVVTGRGDQLEGKNEKWVYEADKNKLFITRGSGQTEFDVLRVSKKKLVIRTEERKNLMTIHLKRWE